MIPIGEDLGVSKKVQIPVVVGKAQISGKKTQVSGRKASGDLTNSVKQQGLKRKGLEKKSIAIATVQRNKGGLRGRKALNDISNSKNVIPIGEDLGVSKKAQIPVVGKAQISGKKTQVSGRKASSDLTNSVKPFGQQQGLKKKGLEKKSIAIAEDEYEDLPYSIAEDEYEGLHNHEKCIKLQEKIDLQEFLETIHQAIDVSCQSVSSCNTSPRKSMDEDLLMPYEESPIPTIEDPPRQYSGQSSPIFGSPDTSPDRWTYMNDVADMPLVLSSS